MPCFCPSDLKYLKVDCQNALPISIKLDVASEFYLNQMESSVDCIAKAEAIRALSGIAQQDATVKQRLAEQLTAILNSDRSRLVLDVARSARRMLNGSD
jgi:hypothetical protein